MIDICYVGNSSIDIIKNSKNQTKNIIGGSAIYSSLSTRYSSNLKIGILTNVNTEISEILKNKKIDLFGNVTNELTTFSIDEVSGKCIGINYSKSKISINKKINTKHLHVSFRKGVDVEKILESKNLKYNTLSIDVMISSVEEFIPLIRKYKDKIDILFCNMKEYHIIDEIIQNIPLKIITNENNPIVAISNEYNKIYEVQKIDNVISNTGAGDSFIGGFLSNYVIEKDIDKSINQGIINASVSLDNFGPIINNEKVKFKFISKSFNLPNNIIVIGNSCAGKTTFIDEFKMLFNIYEDIDDLDPLLEVFLLDDFLYENKINEFKNAKKEILYAKNIWKEYMNDINNIKHYTKKAIGGNGHDIIRPILWDTIIELAVEKKSRKNNIVQFSRGADNLYENEFEKNVYERSLEKIFSNIKNSQNTIIINLISNLKLRKKRNTIRHENGGHYVSDETMNLVYGREIFKCELVNEKLGYVKINQEKIPVFNINNNIDLNYIELKEFLRYNIWEIIRYYNTYKEERKNGLETNSKRYFSE